MANAEAAPRCRLYLITPPGIEAARFADTLAAALAAGDVACVQLRLPGASDEAIRRAAAALMPVCRARDVALVIDEHADVAADTGADGVHLGDGRGVRAARGILGDDAIVGASCGGSRHAAMAAAEAGADYVSFGAFFASPTVPDAALVSTEVLSWWSDVMETPCVAVGGVTPGNCARLVAAGADFLAVSSAVWDHAEGAAAAVRAFNDAVESVGAN